MSNTANGRSNDLLEGLQPHHGFYDVHDLQFGDVGIDDASLPDSQEDNMRQDSDPINAILERQAKAIENLATGIKDIAQALREIALALAPKNQPVVVTESIEVSAFKKALPAALLKICYLLKTFITEIRFLSL